MSELKTAAPHVSFLNLHLLPCIYKRQFIHSPGTITQVTHRLLAGGDSLMDSTPVSLTRPRRARLEPFLQGRGHCGRNRTGDASFLLFSAIAIRSPLPPASFLLVVLLAIILQSRRLCAASSIRRRSHDPGASCHREPVSSWCGSAGASLADRQQRLTHRHRAAPSDCMLTRTQQFNCPFRSAQFSEISFFFSSSKLSVIPACLAHPLLRPRFSGAFVHKAIE